MHTIADVAAGPPIGLYAGIIASIIGAFLVIAGVALLATRVIRHIRKYRPEEQTDDTDREE